MYEFAHTVSDAPMVVSDKVNSGSLLMLLEQEVCARALRCFLLSHRFLLDFPGYAAKGYESGYVGHASR